MKALLSIIATQQPINALGVYLCLFEYMNSIFELCQRFLAKLVLIWYCTMMLEHVFCLFIGNEVFFDIPFNIAFIQFSSVKILFDAVINIGNMVLRIFKMTARNKSTFLLSRFELIPPFLPCDRLTVFCFF